jgi:hypothetical protein
MVALMVPLPHLPLCQSALIALITELKKVNFGQHPGSRLEYRGKEAYLKILTMRQ